MHSTLTSGPPERYRRSRRRRDVAERVGAASDEEIFAFIDNDL